VIGPVPAALLPMGRVNTGVSLVTTGRKNGARSAHPRAVQVPSGLFWLGEFQLPSTAHQFEIDLTPSLLIGFATENLTRGLRSFLLRSAALSLACKGWLLCVLIFRELLPRWWPGNRTAAVSLFWAGRNQPQAIALPHVRRNHHPLLPS